jgi:hypothetical protein
MVGSRLMFMLAALKPATAVMMEAQRRGVCWQSWPNRSAVARREGRNSATPRSEKSCAGAPGVV